MELYEKITFLRKKKGISQQALADILDVSRQSVYKWEQGLTSPDINKLPELARVFDVTVDDLLRDDVDVSKEKETNDEENIKANKPLRKRSMLDYLLLIPFSLFGGILIFMFYVFGFMSVGFLYSFCVMSIASPAYGILLIIININNGLGAILLGVGVIFLGLGLVYPLWRLSELWREKYFELFHRVNKWLKNYDWKGLVK